MIVQAYSMMRTTGISSRGFFLSASRAYSRSGITMGYCHYWKYRPERYGLVERTHRLNLASKEAALLYDAMPSKFYFPPRAPTTSFTSEKVDVGYFSLSRDEESGNFIKTGGLCDFDTFISSMFIAFHRHLPLAFTYTSDGDVDGENLWCYGTSHYDEVVGRPLGHAPGWAEELVRVQLDAAYAAAREGWDENEKALAERLYKKMNNE